MLVNLKPVITETTMSLAKSNWYTFAAPVDTRKNELREMIEKVFKVDVLDIKTMRVKGKKKRSLKNRKTRKLSDWKKAIVKVKEGQKIDVFDQGA